MARPADPVPISPELVLVDPGLAGAERARLDERTMLPAYEASPSPGAAAGDDERKHVPGGPAHRSRRAIALVVLLFAALVAGGAAAAWSLAGDRDAAESPQQAVPAAASPAGPDSVKPTAVFAGRADRLPSAQLLERRLLALLAGAPTSKLPRQLVDVGRRSARTDLRAVCRRSGTRTFRCIIRSPRRPPSEGLYVRYRMRPNGKGFFEWLAYSR